MARVVSLFLSLLSIDSELAVSLLFFNVAHSSQSWSNSDTLELRALAQDTALGEIQPLTLVILLSSIFRDF